MNRPGLDELTPYGFTYREAIESFRSVRERRESEDRMVARANASYREACAVQSCDEALPWRHDKTRAARFCGTHRGRLVAARKQAQKRRAAADLIRERADTLARLPRRLDRLERESPWPIKRAAKEEHRLATRRRYAGPGRLGYVYRLFDAQGALLYVGKTYSVPARLLTGPTSHRATKSWFGDVALVVVKSYRDEPAALDAEAWAIRREAPRYNLARPIPTTPRAPRSLSTIYGAI